jgi:hypothetical protein
MAEVKVSAKLPGTAAAIWNKIGNFGSIDWLPGIEKIELDEGGKVRRLNLAGGMVVIEELVSADESERSYTYRINEGPVPVSNYLSTLRVRDEGADSVIEWNATFEPSGVTEADAVKLMTSIYESGLDNLKKVLPGL